MAQATGPSRSQPATLGDVARLAGVSIATASKALNGRSQVRAETRQRVVEAAERLSFRPNQVARGLLAGRTGTVGLITSDLEGRFGIPILMGAEDAFGAGEVAVFLCDARGDAIREQHHLRALLGRRVDGLIVVGSRTDPRPSLGRELPVPVVYAYAPSDAPEDFSVVPDSVGAGRLAVDHLLACGRTRIAHITGDPGYLAAQDRAEGRGPRSPTPDSPSSANRGSGPGRRAGGGPPPPCSGPPPRHRRRPVRQRPDRPGRHGGPPRARPPGPRRHRRHGLRQLADHDRRLPPAPDQRRHEPRTGRPGRRPRPLRRDRRNPRTGVDTLPCKVVIRGSTAPLS